MSASYEGTMRPRRDSARRVASLIAVGTIAGGDAAREEKTNGYNLSRMDWAQTGSLNLKNPDLASLLYFKQTNNFFTRHVN